LRLLRVRRQQAMRDRRIGLRGWIGCGRRVAFRRSVSLGLIVALRFVVGWRRGVHFGIVRWSVCSDGRRDQRRRGLPARLQSKPAETEHDEEKNDDFHKLRLDYDCESSERISQTGLVRDLI